MSIFGKTIKKIFGTKYDRDVKKYQPYVEQINEYYEQYQSLSADALRQKTVDFRERIAEHLQGIDEDIATVRKQAEEEKDLQQKEDFFNELDKLKKDRDEALEEILWEILPEAFAVVKETARRFTDNSEIQVTTTDHDREIAARGGKYLSIDGDRATWKNQWTAAGGDIQWGMVHYDVQLIGGMVLHDGKVAEMMTGEGKTLVATLPAYLNGLSSQGVHVITVNDYLARRDAEWVGPIFEFLFLTIDCIDKHKPHSPGRIAAYDCDITYGTNNEFGFDYLRDNMSRSVEDLVQGKHHFAMIDEVDSVLIDEARTPLIISGPVGKDSEEQEYIELKPFVERLVSEQKKLATKYLAEAKNLMKDGKLGNDEGEMGMALLRAHRAMPKYRPLIKFLSEDGVRNNLQKAENFYMQEQSKNMHLVDEPLYYVIDEKNRSVELMEQGSEYLAKGRENSDFFIMPDIGMELSEIDRNDAMTEEQKAETRQEVISDFATKSKRLHTINQLLKAYSLFEKDEEYVVMDQQVKIVDEQTGRMMEGRRYSDGLHQALEAKENVKVGNLTQTYATITLQNYFRMYHKLCGMTGTAETEAGELWEIYKLDVVVVPTNRPIQREDHEDMVFRTAREKYNAVIEEIDALTQAGRPVLVGTTSVDISETLSRILDQRNIPHNVLNAKQHQREAEIVAEAGLPGKVTIATNMAGRGTDIKISDEVKAAGGLAIIGTERHDSRRVDRQLRGRAGRQGDPGSSQFYVSLEDKLMRLFRSERISKLMDRMGYKDGEVIQHSMVTKSIENAQKKVEENNFGTRKRLLEYDDVMNIQREAIYKKRNSALTGERLSLEISNTFYSLIQGLVYQHKGEGGDYQSFRTATMATLGYDPEIDEASFMEASSDDITQEVMDRFMQYYSEKGDKIATLLMPEIRHAYENESHKYKRILIPYGDGRSRKMAITADLKTAVETQGESIMTDIEKTTSLAFIDQNWKEHLRSMDELKDSVQAASFEQKDPLVVYKIEAYELFEQLMNEIGEDTGTFLAQGRLAFSEGSAVQEARQSKRDFSKMSTNKQEKTAAERAGMRAGQGRQKVETVRRSEKKVGRNDPCPCGSGKKYKQCHGS